MVHEPLRARGDIREIGLTFDEYREFVAADARYGVALPRLIPQSLRHLKQQTVSDFTAQGIVDHLESVEIHEQNGQRRFRTAVTAQGLVEILLQHHPIGQSRKLIVKGNVTHAIVRTLTLPQYAP
jgi:hypothetical protein